MNLPFIIPRPERVAFLRWQIARAVSDHAERRRMRRALVHLVARYELEGVTDG